MQSRTLILTDGGKGKFWEVTWDGCEVEIAEGEVGTDGEVRLRHFASLSEAREFIEEQIQEKTACGYADRSEVSRRQVQARNPELEALIQKDPDDPAGYLVYADWLQAQGDPRGELITVQQALAAHPTEELERREAGLFKRHAERLLGALWEIPDAVLLSWQLGHVRRARLFVRDTSGELDDESLLRAFLAHPSAAFLQHLIVHRTPRAAWYDQDYDGLVRVLLRAPETLRSLQIGDPHRSSTASFPLPGAILKRPRLKELALFGSVILEPVDSSGVETLALGTIHGETARALGHARWPSLRCLDLGHGALDEMRSMQRLLEPERTPRLRRLILRKLRLSEAYDPLVPLLGRLEQIDLCGSTVDGEGAQVLHRHRRALARVSAVVVSEKTAPDALMLLRELGPELVLAPTRRADERYLYAWPKESLPSEDDAYDDAYDDEEDEYPDEDDFDDEDLYSLYDDDEGGGDEQAVDEGWEDLERESPFDIDDEA